MTATYTFATDVPKTVPVAKTKIFIGTKLDNPANDTFVEIGGVTTIPSYGPTDSPIKIDFVGHRTTVTEKGQTDPGGGDLECAWLPTDAGQIALAAAQADSEGNYNFRLILPNKPTVDGTGTIVDLKAKVMSFNNPGGGASDYQKARANLAFNSLPVFTPASST